MGILSSLFGGGSKKLQILKNNGAVVIDVRTPGEFKSGHVKGSKNYPLQNINTKTEEIRRLNKPVILCCASGMRSGQATGILKSAGIECANGGSWTKVERLYSN
ncbi:rhodanese-like domain-containing protein [Marinoscillum sp.]|uniref:rhodanese-like domain-containing protein n=1 Tax=Marinoscillum sp. TaxID=2024838 RepID=UPI003BA903A8